MKKPANLVNLIEELGEEIHDSTVGVTKESRATIRLDPDNEDGIKLSATDCKLLLHSSATVEQMMDALGVVDEASIELHELDLTHQVLESLERQFAAVDEE
jgi:hypothetical protein